MAPEKGSSKAAGYEAHTCGLATTGDDGWPFVYVPPPTLERWRTAPLLLRLPAVQHALEHGRPLHDELMRDNWLYMLLFVYLAVVGRAVMLFVDFPIVNRQIAQFIDCRVAGGLSALFERFPVVKTPIKPTPGNGCGLLVQASRLLHLSSGGVVFSAAAALLLLAARLLLCYLMVTSCLLNVSVGCIRAVHRLLNDRRPLTSVPVEEVPVLFAKKVMALFWRLPFNLAYIWLLAPLVVQPAEWVVAAVRLTQTLVSGCLLEGGWRADGTPCGSRHVGRSPGGGDLPPAPGADYKTPTVATPPGRVGTVDH